MVQINPATQLTRKERISRVIGLFLSIAFHFFLILGGWQIYQWAEEEEQRERLMVIRRVQEASPEQPRPSQSAPARRQSPREAKVKEKGPEPPPEEAVSSETPPSDLPDVEGDLPSETPQEESSEAVISVLTDLPSATFSIKGPKEFHGAGTFWMRKGPPTGIYVATFHPVSGFRTPPIQTKELKEKSKIIFMGKYTMSTEVKVVIDGPPGATFEIIRPDGKPLGVTTPGTNLFEDLPPGNYLIRFGDVAGFLTPSSQTKSLGRGQGLDFAGNYLPSGPREKKAAAPVQRAATALDRRVQMTVTSYPQTSIEEDFGRISYPEMVIKRSNFQSGWCQVYLIVKTNGGGGIEEVEIERPRREDYPQYARLIETVKSAVRRWDFARASAEVHIDVRFWVDKGLAAALLLGLACCLCPPAVLGADEEECFRCHGLAAFVTRNGDEINSHAVDEQAFESSVHSLVNCRECHAEVVAIPHGEEARKVSCGQKCHQTDPTGRQYSHEALFWEYTASVHGTLADGPLSCMSCHPADALSAFGERDPLEQVLQCASCHREEPMVQEYFRGFHFLALSRGDRRAPTCPDCHSTHRILPPEEVDSSLHPDHILQTCGSSAANPIDPGRCHGILAEGSVEGTPMNPLPLRRETSAASLGLTLLSGLFLGGLALRALVGLARRR